jgi:hypothetical protein
MILQRKQGVHKATGMVKRRYSEYRQILRLYRRFWLMSWLLDYSRTVFERKKANLGV